MSRDSLRPLPDAKDRARAATTFDRNLVVTAGAGTGKTALLVERALNLIGSGRHEIRSLAAITFTEKAAAELRQRLASGLDALQRLAASDAGTSGLQGRTEAERSWIWLRGDAGLPAASIRARSLAALGDLDTASISTIHAFCSGILRRHPDEAGVDPAFVVDEGPAFSLVFDEEWERFLLGELGPSPARAPLWEKALLLPGALGDVRAVARDLAALGLGGAPAGDEPGVFETLLEDLASGSRKRLMSILSSTSGMNPNMTTYLSGAAQLLAEFADRGPAGMAGVTTPLSLDAFLDKAVPEPGRRLEGIDPDELFRTAKQARVLISLLSRVDEERVARIVEAAAPLATRARERFLAAGHASFDSLLQLARDLLARSPSVRRSIASHFGTILVDEFQDTDPLQYEILFFLTEEGDPPSAGAWSARLGAGRLFIVGDPKQSIYRFRGADMEAWRRAVDHVLSQGGMELTLSASFRSPEGIVGPVNRLFSAWMAPPGGEDRLYEPDYRPITSAAGGVEAPLPLVEIWSVESKGLAEENRREEAEAIARWIAESLGGTAATGEPLRLSHVAILLRALTNAGIYAHALRRAGLAYVVEGGRGFYERSEVSDFLALLRAVHNRRDGAAVLAVMRSPVGGVDDVELARFAQEGGRLDGRRMPASMEGFPGIDRTFRLLDRIRGGMRGAPVDRTIDAALDEAGLLLLHASVHDGAQRVANLEKIAWRAGEIARRGLSLEETLRFLEIEYHGEIAQGEAPLADESLNAVRILSVHKAKGLEYPVVIVPDVGRQDVRGGSREAGAVSVQHAHHAGGRFPAVQLGSGHVSAARAWHAIASRRHESAEEKRVFYVACTRAERRLILVNSQTGAGPRPWRDALAALGYVVDGSFPPPGTLADGLVMHRVLQAVAPSPVRREADVDPAWLQAASEFDRVGAAAKASAVPPVRPPSGAGDGDLRITRQASGSDGGGDGDLGGRVARSRRARRDAARLAGSAVHGALERWDFADPARLRALAQAEIDRSLCAGGGGRGVEDLRRRALQEAAAILDGFLGSELPGRLASRLAAQPPEWKRGSLAGLREMPFILGADRDDGPRSETGLPGEPATAQRVRSTGRPPGAACWAGACDLVYRDEDGAIVVADYKTERVDGDFDAAAIAHAPQLAIYAAALRQVQRGAGSALPVRAEVIFVRHGRAVPLPAAGA